VKEVLVTLYKEGDKKMASVVRIDREERVIESLQPDGTWKPTPLYATDYADGLAVSERKEC
jgi:hypothetical protein